MELMSYSSADPAWLNASLSLFALHYDLRLGQRISSECLSHRGEALRLVNEQLNRDSGKHISDATMGAVALLAYFDVSSSKSCALRASTNNNELKADVYCM
jgi:hypothetical protein